MSGPFCTSRDASITPTACGDLPWSLRIAYCARLAVARRLAAVRLHHWSYVSDDPNGDCFRKRRTTWAEILIPPGNWYLRAQGAFSEVLPLRKWVAWEIEVASRLGRKTRILDDQQGLEMPLIPGQSLDELLQANLPLTEKLHAVFLSAAALRKLHQIAMPAFNDNDKDSTWPLSHGDATCRNVIVDAASGTAGWIDFDMRHRPGLSPLTRQADDLRALLWSSAARLDASAHRNCVAAAIDGYAAPEVTREVQRLMNGLLCPTVFQLAQASLAPAEFVGLCEAVRTLTIPP